MWIRTDSRRFGIGRPPDNFFTDGGDPKTQEFMSVRAEMFHERSILREIHWQGESNGST
jgi:hypothetical protein